LTVHYIRTDFPFDLALKPWDCSPAAFACDSVPKTTGSARPSPLISALKGRGFKPRRKAPKKSTAALAARGTDPNRMQHRGRAALQHHVKPE